MPRLGYPLHAHLCCAAIFVSSLSVLPFLTGPCAVLGHDAPVYLHGSRSNLSARYYFEIDGTGTTVRHDEPLVAPPNAADELVALERELVRTHCHSNAQCATYCVAQLSALLAAMRAAELERRNTCYSLGGALAQVTWWLRPGSGTFTAWMRFESLGVYDTTASGDLRGFAKTAGDGAVAMSYASDSAVEKWEVGMAAVVEDAKWRHQLCVGSWCVLVVAAALGVVISRLEGTKCGDFAVESSAANGATVAATKKSRAVDRDLGFGTVKFAASFALMLSHSYRWAGSHLMVFPLRLDPTRYSVGEIMLAVHIVASGYLCAASLARSTAALLPSLRHAPTTLAVRFGAALRKLASRTLRLVVPYFVAIVVLWLVLGAALSDVPLHEYFAQDSLVWRSLSELTLWHPWSSVWPASPLLLAAQELPGLEGFRLHLPLWYLPEHVFCYVLVAAVSLPGTAKGRRAAALLCFSAFAAVHAHQFTAETYGRATKQWYTTFGRLRVFTDFLGGWLLYEARGCIRREGGAVLVALTPLLLPTVLGWDLLGGLFYTPWIALATCVLGQSEMLGAVEKRVGLARLSFGFFLFGTPLQKALALKWDALRAPLSNFGVALALVVPLSWALDTLCAALLRSCEDKRRKVIRKGVEGETTSTKEE